MSIKDKYRIKKIDHHLAMDMVVEHHYMHRVASCNYPFGLFEQDRIVGVICYGSTPSRPLAKGICGVEEAGNVIELTRLWIEDGTPKNTESFFIGKTIRMQPKEIIVSFADKSVGHRGTIYQATNFLYTGLTDKHVQWRIRGMSLGHSRRAFIKYGGVAAAHKRFGTDMIREDRPRKHQYIFFKARGRRRKELLDKLRYKVRPYPK